MTGDGWAGRRVLFLPSQSEAARRRAAGLADQLRRHGVELREAVPWPEAEMVISGSPAMLGEVPIGVKRILDLGTAPPETVQGAKPDLIWTLRDADEWLLRRRMGLPAIAVPHLDPPHPAIAAPPDPKLGLRLGFIGPETALRRFLLAAIPVWRDMLAPLTLGLAPGMTADWPFTVAAAEPLAPDALLLAEGAGPMEVAAALAAGLPVLAEAAAFLGFRPHHAWQSAPDAAALARFAAMLAYEPAQLPSLRLAAEATRRAAALAVEHGLDRSAALISR